MDAKLAIEHLLLRLRPLNRLLRATAARVAHLASRVSLTEGQAPGVCLTEQEAELLLEQVESPSAWCGGVVPGLEPAEQAREQALRAAAAPELLPLEALRVRLGLSDFELEALLLCAAPEVDRAYERLYAFILDDLSRCAPCVELLCSLSASTVVERHVRRPLLARHGRLVRWGLLRLGPEVGSEWRREVRLSAEAAGWLLGGAGRVEAFRDAAEVPLVPEALEAPWAVEEELLEEGVAALRGTPAGVVCVYGPRQSSQAELPRVLAARAGRPLRQLAWATALHTPQALVEAAHLARQAGAVLWLPLDPESCLGGREPAGEREALRALEEAVLHGPPLILSGPRPLRPLELMCTRRWVEVPAGVPSLSEVEARWATLLPEVAGEEHARLAQHFHLSPGEMRTVASLYRAEGEAGGRRGQREPRGRLELACRRVARRRSERFSTVLSPTRTVEDLILPEPVHRSVLDVARFASAWPRVAEQWGLGRMHRGAQGVRALFTGPSGTGKTLSAEVIAGILGQELHKVDLAQLVSKWVGETEKNLDATFDEAEQSQAVLFFDEGESLFGKRSEVRHGTDRYANLEVSYLLQRLEEYSGLVIVASNLKENLDEAFSRRFHVTIDFPRPGEAERQRLWELALPGSVPREGVALAELARLEMTGASIMNAARTAAILASCEGQPVRRDHLAEGIAREYRREGRLLLPAELAALTAGAEGCA